MAGRDLAVCQTVVLGEGVLSPETISTHLLTVLLTAVKEMDGPLMIDQRTLMLGLADALGDLLTTISPAAQRELLPQILQSIIEKVPGGALLVVRNAPTEH